MTFVLNGVVFSDIIFLTFCAILVTLVLQGLTLPALIRALGFAGLEVGNQEEMKARASMLKAGLARLDELRKKDDREFEPICDEFCRMYHRQLEALASRHQEADGTASRIFDLQERYRTVARELCRAERSAVLASRNQNAVGDAVLRELERELDLAEVRYATSTSGSKKLASRHLMSFRQPVSVF